MLLLRFALALGGLPVGMARAPLARPEEARLLARSLAKAGEFQQQHLDGRLGVVALQLQRGPSVPADTTSRLTHGEATESARG